MNKPELPNQLGRQRAELQLRAKSLNVELSGPTISKKALGARQQIQQLETALNVLESSRALVRITELEREREAKQERRKRNQLILELFRATRLEARITTDTIRRVAGEIVDERLRACLRSSLSFTCAYVPIASGRESNI